MLKTELQEGERLSSLVMYSNDDDCRVEIDVKYAHKGSCVVQAASFEARS